MKKSLLLFGCLGFLSSCGTADKTNRSAAEITAKAGIRTIASAEGNLLRCYKKEYSRPHANQKLEKIVVGIYESTTDEYNNFFQIKVTSKNRIPTANGKTTFRNFVAGGTCNLVMSPYPNPMNLDCQFTDDGATGSFGIYERSQDSRNTADYISLLKKMEIQRIASEHAGDAGYIAKLEVEDDEHNNSHALKTYPLKDCREELNMVLPE